MSVGFYFEIQNAWQVNEMLGRLMQEYAKPSDFAKPVEVWWRREVNDVWSKKGAPIGRTWKPNAPGYLEWKRKKGLGTEPNILSGQTKAAMQRGEGVKSRHAQSGVNFLVVSLGPWINPITKKRWKSALTNANHPFGFMNSRRPVQLARARGDQWIRLGKFIQDEINKKDRKIQR